MEFSKLKLELYDLAAIILPGLICFAEVWAALFGFHSLTMALRNLKGTELTVLILFSFAIGNLIQECGHLLITTLFGKRYFKSARDSFWSSPDAELVKSKIKTESDLDVNNVDTAFDYCLTKIKGTFPKRDVFLAISDFSRSLWGLALLGVWPLLRSVVFAYGPATCWELTIAGFFILGTAGWLSWARMVRFRELSEGPVFSAFLACKEDQSNATSETTDAESDD